MQGIRVQLELDNGELLLVHRNEPLVYYQRRLRKIASGAYDAWNDVRTINNLKFIEIIKLTKYSVLILL